MTPRLVTLRMLSEVVEHEPPHLSQVEEEKKRFIHEASPHGGTALSRPNICTTYEIDKSEIRVTPRG